MPEEPGPPGEIAGQHELLSRLRAVVEAKEAENAVLRAELDAERELRRRLELRLAELERRLSMDSSDSGTPSSKERTGAKQARRARQQSERERRADRRRGGQPGHRGNGLDRDPDPDENKDAEPPAQCRRCRTVLDGAAAAGSRWAQVIDVEVIRKAAEWSLPGLACPCCGTVTFAEPPPGAHAGSVSYGPVLNAAMWVLTVTEGCAEAIAFTEGMGLDPRLLVEAISGGPLDSPYFQLKSKAITERQFEPQFKLRLAAKDAALMEDAMQGHHLDLPLVTAIARQLARGAADNPGKDMSASYLTSAPATPA